MKKLFVILALLSSSSLLFSSISYGKWTYSTKSNSLAQTYYIDYDRIRSVDGYVYFWILIDFIKPYKNRHLSAKNYRQGDCKLFRFKDLKIMGYPETMGEGIPQTFNNIDTNWDFPPPKSVNESILNKVCNY